MGSLLLSRASVVQFEALLYTVKYLCAEYREELICRALEKELHSALLQNRLYLHSLLHCPSGDFQVEVVCKEP